jgi:putative intracellular protease/amidase
MLLYPGFTALDLAAPQYAFSSIMGPPVLLVAKTKQPVVSDTGMAIVPTHTFAECPADLSLIFSPGGSDGTGAHAPAL